ncbi:MAG: formimidoylglutamate deiminase, partial [Pseudomonadota bacterium]
PGGPEGAEPVGILLPAPANLHSHAFQRAMAGLSERRGEAGADSFWTWRTLMYRFLDQLDPEDVEAVAALVQMESLEAGFASIGEFHYLHHRPDGGAYENPAEMSARIVAAAAETGIGLTLLPVLYERGGCDGRALGAGQRRFGSDPAAFARLHEGAGAALAALDHDARLGVAPHSLRAVSPAGLSSAAALAAEAPIHMHIAEQQAEVAEVEAAYGARPVAWLLDAIPVDARWCLIHATHMSPAETEGLAQSGAVAGLCPVTEANLGDGLFPGPAFLEAGGRFGVGSDSNTRIDLAEELRTLEYGQRLRDLARNRMADATRSTGRLLFETAAGAGAAALGRDAGTIAVGRLADLVALDAEAPDTAGRSGDTLLDSFVFAAGQGLVREVWSAGRHMVRAGRHIARDILRARYATRIAALRDRL